MPQGSADGMNGETSATSLSTSRLRLRPFGDGDLDRLHELYGDARVMAIRKIGTQDRDGTEAQLQQILDHWRRHGAGLWALFSRDDDRFLGECGLRLRNDGTGELAYGLIPDAWGRGLATEASVAVLDYAFERLRLPRVAAVARADNAASHKVMRKLGMQHVATRPRASDGGVVEFAIEAADWRSSRRR